LLIYLQTIENPKDRGKLEQLYLMYRGFMQHIAIGILKNDQDAEDAVHEAFLLIAKNISKISEPESSKTRAYIWIITERKSLDLYRSRKRRAEEALTEAAGYEEPFESGGNGLMECISYLPDREREALLLKYAHGYTIQEISRMLGISYAAAAKLVERAKAKLEKLCHEEGIL